MYLNKELIKCLAAKIPDVKFDVDFFEYTERKGYSISNNAGLRPEIENREREGKNCRTRVGISGEQGELCNIEVVKRYINIEDVSSIKNNNFYYNILESIPEDNRIKKKVGKIKNLEKDSFNIGEDKFIFAPEEQKLFLEVFKYECDITSVGYKINCLNAKYDIFKTIAVYIE